jgi:TolB protein
MARARAVALVLVLAALGSAACSDAGPDAGDGPAGALVDVHPVDDDIWVTDISSGVDRRLSDGPQLDAAAAWSPDGRRIAFARLVSGDERSGDQDIWLVDLRSGELEPLLSGPSSDGVPTWSPAGDRLAFVSDRGGHDDVWTIELESGRTTQITQGASATTPAFSPRGDSILFIDERDHHAWLVAAEGGQSVPVDLPHEAVALPAWSPGGTSIAYVVPSDERFPELWITDLASATSRRVEGIISPGRPAWSPDGRTLAVMDEADGHLYGIALDTGAKRQLTDNATDDYLPAWSPDGTEVAYNATPNPD